MSLYCTPAFSSSLTSKKVNVGAFVERHFLAFEFGHCLDGRVLGNEMASAAEAGGSFPT
jgi:hypothetical protein